MHHRQGRFEKALLFLQTAFKLLEKLRSRHYIGIVYLNLSFVSGKFGENKTCHNYCKLA